MLGEADLSTLPCDLLASCERHGHVAIYLFFDGVDSSRKHIGRILSKFSVLVQQSLLEVLLICQSDRSVLLVEAVAAICVVKPWV